MHETYEHGSLAALNSPVFIDITLMIGPGAGAFVGVGFVGKGFGGGGFGFVGRGFGGGFGVGEIGRLSAGFTLITEFKFDGGV